MASESTQAPMNGTYHAHHHPSHYVADPYNAHLPVNNSAVASGQAGNENKNEIPKDEVGWFFVEQYYTTLSRSPEKLHLFYSRQSKFVSGLEAQKVTVAVGQKAINERIAELDYHDCKVRVLNVDSQASFDNILVSVIGEISNKAEPPRKFVQTFVLAEQPNGYYVLNDIIRYLNDEDEELVEETPAAEAPAAEPEAPVEAAEQPKAAEPAVPEVEPQVEEKAAVEQVEEKPEINGDAQATEEVAPQTNGTSTLEQAVAPAPVVPTPAVPAPVEAKPEEPKEPAPTPAAAPTKAAPPVPVKETPAPAKAAPMTWASLVGKKPAGAAVATPAPAAAPAASAAQPKAQTPAQTATPPTGTSETSATQAASNDTSGWQTAGADHGKKQSRPQSVSAAGDDQIPAFVKNVNEKVDASLLRQTLARFGKLRYFDVNRQKNCAFVEFADANGYAAAVAANPHQIGGEQVTVEERRPRSTAYGGNAGFGPGRGGHRGRGDGRSSSQGRGGFQKDAGGRGGYPSRGRGGGNVTPKGRSQPQAA